MSEQGDREVKSALSIWRVVARRDGWRPWGFVTVSQHGVYVMLAREEAPHDLFGDIRRQYAAGQWPVAMVLTADQVAMGDNPRIGISINTRLTTLAGVIQETIVRAVYESVWMLQHPEFNAMN